LRAAAAKASGSTGETRTAIAVPTPGLFLALIVGAALLAALVQPTGWLGSDDAEYYQAAGQVIRGERMERAHHHYARPGMILPIAAALALFGHETWVVATPSLLASVACVVVVALLGRRIWGWWEGLLAAAVVSFLPYFRVLSTTAFPDVHVCLWSALAVLLALCAVEARNLRATWALAGLSGLAVGLAWSAKDFGLLSGFGAGGVVLLWPRVAWAVRLRAAAALGGGAFTMLGAECAWAWWATGDPLFRLHALAQAAGNVGLFPAEVAAGAHLPFPSLVWNRLTLLLRPVESGWGWVGALYWPVTLAALIGSRRARALVLWSWGIYLVVAFAPVRLSGGYQPFPLFHGRHILAACIPFALCLAWVMGVAARWIVRHSRSIVSDAGAAAATRAMLPMALVLIVAGAYARPRELNGFRIRPTQRVGVAVRQVAALNDWGEAGHIYMTPSVYLRYGLLLPPALRDRARVAADDSAPNWWMTSGADLQRRAAPLPFPGGDYLLVTPCELAGIPEPWDYGVTLPRRALAQWRTAVPPRLHICRFVDKTIGPSTPGPHTIEHLLILLGPIRGREGPPAPQSLDGVPRDGDSDEAPTTLANRVR
jgi:hypothetical protein